MLIAYYRVSTQRQGRSGLGLEAQQAAVEEHARRLNETVLASYQEIESGRCRERPQLAAALAHAKAAGATIVVAKLDRLARDTAFTLRVLDSGTGVRFLDLPELGSEPFTTRLIITVMSAFAEWEARRISQRIREALAALKARSGGVAFWGRDNLTPANRLLGGKIGRQVYARRCAEHRAIVRPVAKALENEGKTRPEIAAELNARGYRTRRGKNWTQYTVWCLLKSPGG